MEFWHNRLMDITKLLNETINSAIAKAQADILAALDERMTKALDQRLKTVADEAKTQFDHGMEERVRTLVCSVMSEALGGVQVTLPPLASSRRKGTRKWTPEQIQKRKDTILRKKAGKEAAEVQVQSLPTVQVVPSIDPDFGVPDANA